MAIEAYNAHALLLEAGINPKVVDKVMTNPVLSSQVLPLLEDILNMQIDKDASKQRPNVGPLKARSLVSRETPARREVILNRSPKLIDAQWQIIRERLSAVRVS